MSILLIALTSLATTPGTTAPLPLCGPLSVAFVLNEYGIDTDFSQVCAEAGYDPSTGTTLTGLKNACAAYGLNAIAVETQRRELPMLLGNDMRAIVVLPNHFAVVQRHGDGFCMVDAVQRLVLPYEIDGPGRMKVLLIGRHEFEVPGVSARFARPGRLAAVGLTLCAGMGYVQWKKSRARTTTAPPVLEVEPHREIER